MWHFDTPLYLDEELGGWKNRAILPYWDRYVRTILTEYKGLVKNWLTINEINNTIQFLGANKPAATRTSSVLTSTCITSSWRARTRSRSRMRSRTNTVWMHDTRGVPHYPLTCDPADVLLTQRQMERCVFYCGDVQAEGKYPVYAQRLWDEHDVHVEMEPEDAQVLAEGAVDFYTFSYYMTTCDTTHEVTETAGGNMSFGAKNPYLKYSDWGWALDAMGRVITSRWFIRPLREAAYGCRERPRCLLTRSRRRTARFTIRIVSITCVPTSRRWARPSTRVWT